MSFSALRKEMAELTEIIKKRQSSNYQCITTANGSLKIIFEDGRIYRIPHLKFRDYQGNIQYKLFVEGVRRFFLVWPRRAGKEVVSWNLLVQAALTDPGLYMMIYPTAVRARTILWKGAISLMDTGESLRFIDMIPKEFILKKNEQSMTIELINGSIIQVTGSDLDIDKFRGINPKGIIYSEYAYSDPRVRQTLDPAFRQNKGWYIIQTTFDGTNHAYSFFQNVKSDPAWYCETQTVETLKDTNGNRYITDEMIDEDRRAGMPEWFIQQEYYCTIQTNNDKFYFSNEVLHWELEGKLIGVPVMANFPIYAFYDIGIRDSAAVTLVQFDNYHTPYIVGYIENKNQGAHYYIREIEKFCVRNYTRIEGHYLPHDAANKNFGNAKSTMDIFQEAGEKAILVPKISQEIDGVNAIRRVSYRCLFHKDNTTRLRDCIANYEKEFDEKHDIFKDRPIHNWASHGVKSFQTFALAMEAHLVNAIPNNLTYYSQ